MIWKVHEQRHHKKLLVAMGSAEFKFQLAPFRPCSQNSSVQVISRGFQSISWSVGLLFLEIFDILEGGFSYFVEFIYCT